MFGISLLFLVSYTDIIFKISSSENERAANRELLFLQAIEHIKAELASGRDGKQVKLEFMALDLASLSSVKEFTVAFQGKNLPLHILVNNAGIAWVPLG